MQVRLLECNDGVSQDQEIRERMNVNDAVPPEGVSYNQIHGNQEKESDVLIRVPQPASPPWPEGQATDPYARHDFGSVFHIGPKAQDVHRESN